MMTLKADRMKKPSKILLFDADDEDSYYFGNLKRTEANAILEGKEYGVFLIRNSSTKVGDKVLCVVEQGITAHYIINFIENENDEYKWIIGSNKFPNIPSLLRYYSIHVLSSYALTRPADHEKYIATAPFEPEDPDYLRLVPGMILTMFYRMEGGARPFRMKSETGEVGLVSQDYVEKYDPSKDRQNVATSKQVIEAAKIKKTPAKARVIRDRCPNAYDLRALHIKKDDEIYVTAIHDDGMWEAELIDTKQKGFVPFTYIEFIERDVPLHLPSSIWRASHAVN